MTERRLVIKLDQYAGNVDELVCVALLGYGNGRYGEEEARKVYDEKVVPVMPKDEYDDFPLETYSFNTKYGSSAYELDTDINAMRIGIDNYVSMEDIMEDIQSAISIWKKAYANSDGVIEINILFKNEYYSGEDRITTVKVLGFDLIEIKEYRTVIE